MQQGNVLEQKHLDQLEAGMNKEQVRFLLGTPALNDALGEQQWDYYFSLKGENGEEGETRSYWVLIQFQQDRYQKYVVGKRVFNLIEESS